MSKRYIHNNCANWAGSEWFVQRLANLDETWVTTFKQQSKQRKHLTSSPLKKARIVPSAGKMMASCFWGYWGCHHGVLSSKRPDNKRSIWRYTVGAITGYNKDYGTGDAAKSCALPHQDNASEYKLTIAIKPTSVVLSSTSTHPVLLIWLRSVPKHEENSSRNLFRLERWRHSSRRFWTTKRWTCTKLG